MVSIELQLYWDTLEEATDYFLDLVLELHAYKRHHQKPTNLFLNTETGDAKLNDKVLEAEPTITLESLK